MVRFRPHECPHARTSIYYEDETTKVEKCKQCDTIVQRIDLEDPPTCGAPTASDGTCSRRVSKPSERCWQHAS